MIEIELRYPAELNWSVLRVGVPFVLSLSIRRKGVDAANALPFWLSLPGYLERLKHVMPPGIEDASRDISGDLMAKLSMAWRIENAWRHATERQVGDLTFTFPGDRVARCPVNILPPTHWCRGGGDLTKQRLRVTHARIAIGDVAEASRIECNTEWLAFETLTFPPLETSVVALLDPRAPYARVGSDHPVAVALDQRLQQRTELPGHQLTAQEVATAVRQAMAGSGVPSARELQGAEEDSIPLLVPDTTWGTAPVDPALLACELMEGREVRPILVVTGGGKRLGAAFWMSGDAFPEQAQVCRDAEAFRSLLDDRKVTLFGMDASDEGEEHAVEEAWAAIGSGFLYAVDVARCRQQVSPIPRPLGRSESWLAFHVERLKRQLAFSPERSAAVATTEAAPSDLTQLDDPAELFVAVSCRVGSGGLESVLGSPGRPGWLEEQLIVRPGRVAILADGGSGKTYLSRRFAGDIVNRLQLGDDVPVPIWFPLRSLSTAQTLIDAIAQSCELGTGENLRRLAARHRLIIILDALDESGREYSGLEEVRGLLDPVCDLPGASILLTSRAAIFQGAPTDFLSGFEIAELQGWSESDLFEYLIACRHRGVVFAKGPEAFHRFILSSENLRGLARTPLFARMIVETRDQIEAARDVRDDLDLYRHYCMFCLGRRLSDVPAQKPEKTAPLPQRRATLLNVEEAAGATAEIAKLMFVKGQHAVLAVDAVRELSSSLPGRGVDDYRHFMAEEVLVHGLLGPDLSLRDERRFRFIHVSLEHYFLAERLHLDLRSAVAAGKLPFLLATRPLPQAAVQFLARIMSSREAAPWREVEAQSGPATVTGDLALLMKSTSDQRHLLLNIGTDNRAASSADIAFRNAALVHLAAGGNLVEADLSDLDFTGADLANAVLRGARLDGARLNGSTLNGADLSGCSLTQAQVCDVDVTGTRFVGADFHHSELRGLRTDGRARPLICGARNLETLLVDPDSRATLTFLVSCLADCGDDAIWSVRAVKALVDTLARLESPGRQ